VTKFELRRIAETQIHDAMRDVVALAEKLPALRSDVFFRCVSMTTLAVIASEAKQSRFTSGRHRGAGVGRAAAALPSPQEWVERSENAP
jgi:hypothetical protein